MSRRQFIATTQRDRDARPAPDLVNRNFQAPAPDRLWVADITYILTWAGFLYLDLQSAHRRLGHGGAPAERGGC